MTWSNTTRYGNGRLRFAVIIEGWPEIWVTDHSVTLSDETLGAVGRTVRVGLQRQGLQFSERALLLQGKIEASAMTFRFVSNDHTKRAVASFATVPTVDLELADDLETADTSITLQGGATIANTLYRHIGTEVFQSTGSGNITRGHWDTQAQSFYLLDGEDQLSHQIYTRPRTMEGRRATLYVWGDGDDSTGYDPTGADETVGRPIWRGIVTLPPRLDRDGVTWTITADHISKVFDQQLCARNTEVRPVGIHFPYGAPIFTALRTIVFIDVLQPRFRHICWFQDTAAFLAFMNTALADMIADTSTDLDRNFDHVTMHQDISTGGFYLLAVTNSSPAGNGLSPAIDIRSHYTGTIAAGAWATWPWVNTSTGLGIDAIAGIGNEFEASTQYKADFTRESWSTESPFGSTQPLFGMPPATEPARSGEYYVTVDEGTSGGASPATIAEWSEFRIFIDREWDALAARAITIERNSFEPLRGPGSTSAKFQTETLTLNVEDSGYDATLDAHWILVENTGDARAFHGWVHSDTVMRPTYSPAARTDVVGFVSSIITDVAANANDGNLPFIRSTDFDTSTEIVSALPDITNERNYRFVKPVAISDVIAEELKLVGYMWSTDADTAKLTFRPIPILTGTIALTEDAQGDDIEIGPEIQTPAAGSGSFPGYEIQSQGIVSVVYVKDGYDAAKDEHAGTSHTVADANLLSTHKRRALTELTIAPKSTADVEITVEDAQAISARMMAVLGREYVTVKVRVPFSRFYVLLGDVVGLTSPHVPNSSGTMGVSGKRCLVVGRTWNLDPGRNEHGELELLMLLEDAAGYAPSGVITSQTGATTTWVLTLSASNAANILISPRGDGYAARTFAVDDEIRIVQSDAASPTIRQGTVTAQSGATVSVTLDASWTPGSDSWNLEYDGAPNVTATQLQYCFIADSSGDIGTNSDPARRFS